MIECDPPGKGASSWLCLGGKRQFAFGVSDVDENSLEIGLKGAGEAKLVKKADELGVNIWEKICHRHLNGDVRGLPGL